MSKNDPKLFPQEFHLREFSIKDYETKEEVPLLKFPVGFHAFCLLNIAQYYEEKGTEIFNNLLFSEKDSAIITDSIKDGDFSRIFEYTTNFFVRKLGDKSITKNDLLQNLTDRSPHLVKKIMSIGTLGLSDPIVMEVPVGNEEGIVYSLSASHNYDVSQIFVVDTKPEMIPRAVNVTAAQPYIFNDVIELQFPLLTSIEKKRITAITTLSNLSIGQFELQWALVTIKGVFSLIICRNPFFIRIADNSTMSFNSLDDAFEDCRVLAVCYRYAEFSSTNGLFCSQNVNKLHNKAIESDASYLSISMKKYTDETFKDNLAELITNCIIFPALYFKTANYKESVGCSASFFVQYPDNYLSASYIVGELIKDPPPYNNVMDAVSDYNRFLIWVRSITAAIRAIVSGDLDKLLTAFSSCFYSLPVRVDIFVSATIRLVMNSLNIFRKKRGMNEKFAERVLIQLAHAMGPPFADILGFKKYDLFRSCRGILVTQEKCSYEFIPMAFKNNIVSPDRAIDKLIDAVIKLKGERNIDFTFDSAVFNFDNEYIEFLKSQSYKTSILQ